MNVRDLFPGYYPPTDEDFTELWHQCIFSFDANVLLHIYRYSLHTRERLFEILQLLQERIWITHQVAYEIHRNRLIVISNQSEAYKGIQAILDDNLNIEILENQLFKKYRKHPYIDVNQIIKPIKDAIEKVEHDLQLIKQEHPDLVKNDPLWNKLINLLVGRVGQPYYKDKLKEIYQQAEQRFKDLTPPGNQNINKPEPDKYGDILLWLQLIDHAKVEKKPIVFVTDDKKDDWWLEYNGTTISPRPELVQEMLNEAGVKFYMYQADQFLEYAEIFLKLPKQPEAVAEAREIREHNANYQNYSHILSEERSLNVAELNKLIIPITKELRLHKAELDKLNPITEELRLHLKKLAQLKPFKKLDLNPDDSDKLP